MAGRGGGARRGLCGVCAVIFATVGTQLPFPRLIKTLDQIAGRHGLEVMAQTSDPGGGAAHIEVRPYIDPREFDRFVRAADVLVGHAGIGTVLTAKKFGKPLIIFPRRASLNEHRNDHQLATASKLGHVQGVHVAWDDDELEQLLVATNLAAATNYPSPSAQPLIQRLSDFIAAA